MTAMNGVGNKVVAFRGEQDERKSGGIGVGVPILGAAVGTGVVAIKNKGFGKVSLDTLEKDTFSKAMAEVKDLTEDEKAAVKTLQEHLEKPVDGETKTNPEAKTAGETAEETKTTTEGSEAKAGAKEKSPKSLVSERSLDDVFGKGKEAKAEIMPDKYYEKYGSYANRETVDGIKSQLGKEAQAIQGHIVHAKNQAKRVDAFIEKTTQMTALQKQIAEIEKARAEDTFKILKKFNDDIAELTDETAKTKVQQKAAEEIARVEKQTAKELTGLYGKRSDLSESLAKVEKGINLTTNKGNKIIGLEPTQETINKALKEKGLEPNGAETKKLTEEAFDQLANERVKKLRKLEPNMAYDKAKIKAYLMENPLNKAKVDASVEKKIAAARAKEIAKVQEAHLAKLKEVANGEVTHFERKLARTKAKLGEVNADINLVETAKKNKSKITRAQAEEVLSTTSEKVKSAVKELGAKAGNVAEEAKGTASEAVAKAFETIKGKLPGELKKFNLKGLALGAGIGLVGGIVAKLIFGGKSEG